MLKFKTNTVAAVICSFFMVTSLDSLRAAEELTQATVVESVIAGIQNARAKCYKGEFTCSHDTLSAPDNKKIKNLTYTYLVEYSPSGFIARSMSPKHDSHHVDGGNPKYYFSVGNKSKGDPYTLDEVNEQQRTTSGLKRMHGHLLPILSPFTVLNATFLDDFMSSKDLVLSDIHDIQSDGMRLVKMNFSFINPLENKINKERIVDGSLTLRPDYNWTIQDYKLNLLIGDNTDVKHTSSLKIEYDKTNKELPRKVIVEAITRGANLRKQIWNYTFNAISAPEKPSLAEYYIPYYGLPEYTPPRSSLTWVYASIFLAAGIVLVLIAYLARQRGSQKSRM